MYLLKYCCRPSRAAAGADADIGRGKYDIQRSVEGDGRRLVEWNNENAGPVSDQFLSRQQADRSQPRPERQHPHQCAGSSWTRRWNFRDH